MPLHCYVTINVRIYYIMPGKAYEAINHVYVVTCSVQW
jgi:hypothetical protein